jgi:hypothetical protein
MDYDGILTGSYRVSCSAAVQQVQLVLSENGLGDKRTQIGRMWTSDLVGIDALMVGRSRLRQRDQIWLQTASRLQVVASSLNVTTMFNIHVAACTEVFASMFHVVKDFSISTVEVGENGTWEVEGVFKVLFTESGCHDKSVDVMLIRHETRKGATAYTSSRLAT